LHRRANEQRQTTSNSIDKNGLYRIPPTLISLSTCILPSRRIRRQALSSAIIIAGQLDQMGFQTPVISSAMKNPPLELTNGGLHST